MVKTKKTSKNYWRESRLCKVGHHPIQTLSSAFTIPSNRQMEFGGVEVKAGKSMKVKPGYGKLLHLSKASLRKFKMSRRKEFASTILKSGDQKLFLDTLLQENDAKKSLNSMLEKELNLYHNQVSGSVYLEGYKSKSSAKRTLKFLESKHNDRHMNEAKGENGDHECSSEEDVLADKNDELGKKKSTLYEETTIKKMLKEPAFLPRDIITEILSWLAVKSLLQFRCVCKEWNSIIQDPYFISKHYRRGGVILYYASECEALWILDDVADSVVNEDIIRAAFNGLLLEESSLNSDFWIRNPATRQLFHLPNPHRFSFDIIPCLIPSTGKHKLVSIYHAQGTDSEMYEVLEVGSEDLSWKPLRISYPNEPAKTKRRISTMPINGVLHSVWLINVGSYLALEVESIDLESESSTWSILPQGIFSDLNEIQILSWNGFLSIARTEKEELGILVLEDFKRNKWGEKKTSIPLRFLKENQDMNQNLTALCFEDNELYLSWNQMKILCYNVKFGKITKVFTANKGERIKYMDRESLVGFEGIMPLRRLPRITL